MALAATAKPGLRERKKQRTRQAIVEVGTRLFVEQGYQQTTLVQIAEEVEVAPSTFFNYFPTKVDLVFCFYDAVIESAKNRIADRPEGEPALDAIISWLRDDLLSVELPYAESIRRMPAIVEAAPELRAEERLRGALLEDVLAEGFARDLHESPDGVRSRVLAAMALRGMLEAWAAWFEKHAGDAEFHLEEALEAKAERVTELLAAGLELVEQLPGPHEPAVR